MIVRGTRDLRSGIGLCAINQSRYEVLRWTNQPVDRNWDTGGTVLATINVVPSTSHSLEVDYLDGELVVRINGTEVSRIAEVGGPVGPTGRFLGFQAERATDGFFTYYPSPWFGVWSAQDLPQSAGGNTSGNTDK